MKNTTLMISLLLLSTSLQAEELVRAVSLSEDPLTISSVAGEQRHVLIEVHDPGITSSVYALKGNIRYDNVQGDGFLQMDNHFGESGTFFTKGIAPAGPLGKISGNSEWRPFVLPFYATNGEQPDGSARVPERLTLSLFLPGAGSVSISGVELYQYASGEDPMRSAGQWIDARSAGLIGGIGGALIGLWGAIIGVIASRGKARAFVFISVNVLLSLGLVSLVAGAVAYFSDQPYAVYFPLLLIGIILVAVIGKMRGSLLAQYEQLELKRMQSMDV